MLQDLVLFIKGMRRKTKQNYMNILQNVMFKAFFATHPVVQNTENGLRNVINTTTLYRYTQKAMLKAPENCMREAFSCLINIA